jgi:prephenate dehydratase/chorismate mutase/prephenate dehydratase
MELAEIRHKIDRIDYQLVKLLNDRMELALRTKSLKPQVLDEEREKKVMENVNRFARGLVPDAFLTRIFTELIAESKRLQGLEFRLIGFQGEHGANSEAAARAYDPELLPIPCPEFTEVFAGVADRNIDLGILPVENSLEGAVTEVNDLLITHHLKIVGEIKIPIHYCLLTLPETDYREIKVVYSHPQALAQCRKFIARNRLEARPFYDTAGAAKMIAETRSPAAAAIANRSSAEYYNLEIIKENIEDESTNSTRFLILSRENGEADGDKCSIVFSTRHEAGALFHILRTFADASINLTRIESRPNKTDPGKYIFLLDFKGSPEEDNVRRVLEEVERKSVMYKFLGCYKEA